MAQPADFYQKKHEALIYLKNDLTVLINTVENLSNYELKVADNPDVAVYTKLIENLRGRKMALDLPIGNAERMMHETK